MKCKNCGKPVEEGRLFCNHCGWEIQWVPDYDSLGTYMEQERIKKEKKEKAEEEAARRRAAHLAELKQKKKRQKKLTILCSVIVVLGAGAAGIGWKLHTDQKNYNDFSYQMRMADTAFSNHKYTDSYSFVKRALELNEEDTDAQYLMAQILLNQKKTEDAIAVLEKLIAENASNTDAYGLLIKTYTQEEQPEKIKELLDACEDEKVLKKFGGYISKAPVFSLPEGSYSDSRTLALYAKEDGDVIYYTTDGTDPTPSSEVYMNSISLEEGTTTVKAIVVNEKGIPSDVVSKTYEIAFEAPAAPQISPSSGKFTTNMDTEIYVIVPNGCRAYYAFDRIPTITDEQYTSPVAMKKGKHTFYAILIDEHNKISEAGSAEYTLTDPE